MSDTIQEGVSWKFSADVTDLVSAYMKATNVTQSAVAAAQKYGNISVNIFNMTAAAATKAAGGIQQATSATSAHGSTAANAAAGVIKLASAHHAVHGAAGNARVAVMEFEHGVRSMIDGLAAGANPMRLFMMEFSRLSQAVQMGGGLKNVAQGALGMFAPMIAPFKSPIGLAGIAAAGTIGFGAQSTMQWESAQNQIWAALNGRGRASGFTQGGFDAAALTGAATANISDTQARATLAALIQTGRIGSGLGVQLLGTTKQFSRASGLGVDEAGETLAKAFGNPDTAKGLDLLNEKVGGFDDKTRHLVDTLQAQGNVLGAQNALFDAYSKSIAGASTRMEMYSDKLSQFWNKVADLRNKLGESVAAELGDETTQHRIQALQEQLKRPVSSLANFDIFGGEQTQSAHDAAQKELDELTAKQRAADEAADAHAKDEAAAQRSLQVGPRIQALVPDLTRREDLQNQSAELTSAVNDPLLQSHLSAATVAGLSEALERVNNQLTYFATNAQKIGQDSQLAATAMAAEDATMRTAADAAKAYLDAIRSAAGEAAAAAAATAKWNEALAESSRRADEALRQAEHTASLGGLSPLGRAQSEARFRASEEGRQMVTHAPPNITQAAQATVDAVTKNIARGIGGSPPLSITVPAPSAWDKGVVHFAPQGAGALGAPDFSGSGDMRPELRSKIKDFSKFEDLYNGQVQSPGADNNNSALTKSTADAVEYKSVVENYILDAQRQARVEVDATNASLAAQNATFGKSPAQIAAATKAMELWNQVNAQLHAANPAQDVKLTADQTERLTKAIGDQAAAAGQQAQQQFQQQQATAGFEDARDLFRSGSGDVTSSLFGPRQDVMSSLTRDQRDAVMTGRMSMSSARWQAAGNSLKTMMSQKLIGMGLDQMTVGLFGKQGQPGGLVGSMLAPMFGSQSNGGGLAGLISGLFGGGSSGGTGLGTFGGFYASGGTISPGQWGVTGERGPEIVVGGRSGATVIPMRGGSVSPTIHNTTQIVVQGDASEKTLALIDARVSASHAQLSKDMTRNFQTISRQNSQRFS